MFGVLASEWNEHAGITKLYPLVEFDLQSGEAGLFQRVFRKVRGRYANQMSEHNQAFKAVEEEEVMNEVMTTGAGEQGRGGVQVGGLGRREKCRRVED